MTDLVERPVTIDIVIAWHKKQAEHFGPFGAHNALTVFHAEAATEIERLNMAYKNLTHEYNEMCKRRAELQAENMGMQRTLRDRQHPATEPRDSPDVLRTIGFWPECGCGECYAIHCLDVTMNELNAARASVKESL